MDVSPNLPLLFSVELGLIAQHILLAQLLCPNPARPTRLSNTETGNPPSGLIWMIIRTATCLAKSLSVCSQVAGSPAEGKHCPAVSTEALAGFSKGLMLWKFQNDALFNYLADNMKPFRGIIRTIQKEPDVFI